MDLAVVRSLGAPRRLDSAQEREDFEQELVDQFLLAAVGAGACDGTVLEARSVIFEFARFLGGRCGRAAAGRGCVPGPAAHRAWEDRG